MELEELSDRVIGCAIEVHRWLGPGLLESAYTQCLAHELTRAGVAFERERSVGISYKGVEIDCGFRLDMLVENLLIIEVKAVDKLQPVHRAQLLTYMKLTGKKVGLLINFNCRVLKDGWRGWLYELLSPCSPCSPCSPWFNLFTEFDVGEIT